MRSHCKVRYEAADLISTLHLHQHNQVHSNIYFINLRLHLIVWPLGWVHSPHAAFVSSLPLKGIFFFSTTGSHLEGSGASAGGVWLKQGSASPAKKWVHRTAASLRGYTIRFIQGSWKNKKNKCCFDEKGDYHSGGITERIHIDKRRMKKTTTLHCV